MTGSVYVHISIPRDDVTLLSNFLEKLQDQGADVPKNKAESNLRFFLATNRLIHLSPHFNTSKLEHFRL